VKTPTHAERLRAHAAFDAHMAACGQCAGFSGSSGLLCADGARLAPAGFRTDAAEIAALTAGADALERLAQPAGEHAQPLRKQAEDARRHLAWLSAQEPYPDADNERGRLRAIDTLRGRIAAWEAGADALAEVERLRAQVAECVRHAQHMNTVDAEQEAENERLRTERNEAREQAADAAARIEQQRARLRQMEERWASAVGTLPRATLIAERDAAVDEAARLLAEVQRLNQCCDTVETSHDLLFARVEAQNAELARLRALLGLAEGAEAFPVESGADGWAYVHRGSDDHEPATVIGADTESDARKALAARLAATALALLVKP
jgi:chromosome segregation ATPase